MPDGVHVTKDNVAGLVASVRELTKLRVMVGVPDVNADKGREPGDPYNNAQLAKIHDQGAPEVNIPARPFMGPGIAKARPQVEGWTRRAGVAALRGDAATVMRCMHAAGLAAVSAVQSVITAGIPPPLAESTVRARIARRSSANWKRKRRAAVAANVAAGKAPGEGLFTPLIDTGALRASITYVIRRLGRGSPH